MTLYLNIGSNIGDRRGNLLRAVALLMQQPCIIQGTLQISTAVTSPPWGFSSANNFLNIGVKALIDPATPPLTILKNCQHIQHTIDPSPHRDKDGNYIDRKIDIDIIAIDNLTIDTPELTIPHPRMHLRDFVLRPMKELAPDWIHPLLGKL